MNQSGFDLGLLDTADPALVESYERALFRAFASVITNTTEQIFEIDYRARRLRTRLPYTQQEILIARNSDVVLAGTAVNFDMQSTLQLELLGFTIDKCQPGICEALALFSILDPLSSAGVLKKLHAILLQRLSGKGIRKVYGTCADKRLRSYELIGFEVVDKFRVQGQGKYLLALDLNNVDVSL